VGSSIVAWSAAERSTLTHHLISRVGRPDVEKQLGLYFASADGDWAALARYVERTVFLEAFGNDQAQMDREYGRYEASSFFILAIDHRMQEPVGMIRILEQSDVGLKTISDIEQVPGWGASYQQFLARHCGLDDPNLILDIATLAVLPEWTSTASGMLTAAALYGGVYRCAHAIGARQVVATLDESVAALLSGLDVPLDPICDLPAIEYLGSPNTRPYVIQVGLAETIMRTNQKLTSVLMGGMVDRDFSLPPIDLDNPNPHPIELEPQFIIDPEPVDTTTRDSVEHSAPID